MDREIQKAVDYILRCSDAPERDYIYTQEVAESEDVKYNYYAEAVKLKRYSTNELGMVSDAFILYMVTLLETASTTAITNMLEAYGKSYKELTITNNLATQSMQKVQHVEARLKFMLKSGFLFSRSYDVGRPDGSFAKTVLYGIDKDTQSFMNKKLNKHVVIRPWTIASPLNEAIAGAAVAHVASLVASKSGCRFKAIKEDALKTTEMGTIILPPCLFLDGAEEEKFQVMFYPAFLNQVRTYQTDGDFERAIKYKLDCIRNYFYAYGRSEYISRKPYCVVVCESRQDMENMRKIIQQTKLLVKYGSIANMYFTSEGAVNIVTDLKDAFLKLEVAEDGELFFTKEIPPFIKAR